MQAADGARVHRRRRRHRLRGRADPNVRPPVIMSTFAENFDFSGKTIHPFVTYAVSELGTTMETYEGLSAGATISSGLSVLGETVGHADPQVRAWLRHINLLR
jgi:hypothetical protein